MDQVLLNCYLKYIKEKRPSIWKVISRKPWYILIPAILSLLSLVATIIVGIFAYEYVWIPEIISACFTILLYIVTEKYTIKRSDISFQNYIDFCADMKDWLSTIRFSKMKDLTTLKKYLSDSLDKRREEDREKKARTDKWMQTMIIPITLAIISAIIGKQDNIAGMVSNIIEILMLFVIIYGFVQLIRSFWCFHERKRTEQLQFFVDDLNSILIFEQLENKNSDTSLTKNDSIKISK